MYELLLRSHVAISSLFILVALFFISRTLYYINSDKVFGKLDRRIEIIYLGLLYISFIQGISLYFLLQTGTSADLNSLAEARANATNRFWAIEHSAVMIFALLLSQIGRFFTSQNISHRKKRRYSAFYYGTATLFTLISLSLFMIEKFAIN